MPRSVKRHRGGDGGELFENAALVGLGAYAAKHSDGTGWGILTKVGSLAMYASIAGFILIAIILLIVLVAVLKAPATTTPTVTKEPMDVQPHSQPQGLGATSI